MNNTYWRRVLLLASGLFCGFFFLASFLAACQSVAVNCSSSGCTDNTTATTLTATATVTPGSVANSYYQALEQQDYAQAYHYLDKNARVAGRSLSQQQFAQLYSTAVKEHGSITSFGVISVNKDVHVMVSRQKQIYGVTLQFTQNGLKITSVESL